MKANANIFWVITVFFIVVGVVYGWWTWYSTGTLEAAGTIALILVGLMGALIAFYISKVHRAQGGELPEDRLDANIDDGDPEVGFYSPWSWWPIMLAGSAALMFLGLGAGFWICFIAVGLGLVSLVGWVYEYYRGLFAR